MNKQSDRATRSRNHQSPSGCVVSECTLSGCTISSHISLIFRRQNNHVSCHLTTQEMLTRQANKKVFWLCVNSYLLVIEFMNIIGSTNRGYIWGRGRGDERARASIVRNYDYSHFGPIMKCALSGRLYIIVSGIPQMKERKSHHRQKIPLKDT